MSVSNTDPHGSALKVGVSGQTNWGSKIGSIDGFWHGTVALGIEKIWNFAVVF